MIFLESMLLWVIAGVALILILQYVMKTPLTPARPEFGLGKRFPLGARRVRSAYVENESEDRPRKESPARRRANLPVAAVETPREPARKVRQTVYVEPEVVPVLEPIVAEASQPVQTRGKKRTDTMQLMLNKAMSERR